MGQGEFVWLLRWIADTSTNSDPLNGLPPWAWVLAGLSIPSIGCSVLWKALVNERRQRNELAERAIPLLAQTVQLLSDKQRQSDDRQRDDVQQMLSKVERLVERLDDRR